MLGGNNQWEGNPNSLVHPRGQAGSGRPVSSRIYQKSLGEWWWWWCVWWGAQLRWNKESKHSTRCKNKKPWWWGGTGNSCHVLSDDVLRTEWDWLSPHRSLGRDSGELLVSNLVSSTSVPERTSCWEIGGERKLMPLLFCPLNPTHRSIFLFLNMSRQPFC